MEFLKKYIYLFCFILFGCIEPYDVSIEDGPQLLTIEGMLTNGPGPHVIKLTRSDTYGSVFEGLIRPVAGATVIFRDDLGRVIFLSEDNENRGNYLTPAEFSGETGRTYTLQIQLLDGKVYSSLPEKLTAVPEIQDLGFRVERIPVKGEINDASGIQFIAEFQDPADENNFYYWRKGESVHVYETRPDLYHEPPPSRAPAPKDCCAVCFKTEQTSNASIFIAQDDNFNGLTTRLPVAFILDDGLRFLNRYRVDLEQYSISQEAYRFLRLVKQQAELSGSVFDPPPANIRGNMISLDNPEEVVFGFFMAAGESSKRIYINQSELDFKQPRAIIPDDCRVFDNSQLDPPADWIY
ncbi:DUF4249 domain-containing protein [Algoriphagus aestuarii]|nr:DUF4249 domain-containing protein [Algoriphagus aestuarii]